MTSHPDLDHLEVCKGGYYKYIKQKRSNPRDSQGNEKNQFLFLLLLVLKVLSEMTFFMGSDLTELNYHLLSLI